MKHRSLLLVLLVPMCWVQRAARADVPPGRFQNPINPGPDPFSWSTMTNIT
jgi:hypothetical protein